MKTGGYCVFFLSLSLLAPPSVGLNKPCRAFRIPTNDGDVVGVVVVALSSQCGRCFPLVFVRVVCKKPQDRHDRGNTPALCLLANASLAPEHQLVSITNLRSRICEVSSASHSSCLQLGRWVLNTQPAVCFVSPPPRNTRCGSWSGSTVFTSRSRTSSATRSTRRSSR